MYPRLAEWRQTRDSVDPERLWRSDLAERTRLVAPRTAPAPPPGTVAPENRVLLLGGSSEIGLAIVRRLGRDGPVAPYLSAATARRSSARWRSSPRRAAPAASSTSSMPTISRATSASWAGRSSGREGSTRSCSRSACSAARPASTRTATKRSR